MTINQEKAAKVIAAIRKHYESQGISLERLDDRQLEMGVRQLAAAAREAGMTKEQALEKMRDAVAQLEAAKAAREAAAEEEGDGQEDGEEPEDAA